MSIGGALGFDRSTQRGSRDLTVREDQVRRTDATQLTFAERLANEIQRQEQIQQSRRQELAEREGRTEREGTREGVRDTEGQILGISGERRTAMDSFGRAALDTLTTMLGETLDLTGSQVPAQFGKDNALLDSQAIMENVLRSAAEDVFPKLTAMQAGAGAFNTTTAELLRDKAIAQAAREAANLQFETVQRYADITAKQTAVDTQQQESLLNALVQTLGLQAEVVQDIDRDELQESRERSAEQILERDLARETEVMATQAEERADTTAQTVAQTTETARTLQETEEVVDLTLTREEEEKTKGTGTSVSAGLSGSVSGASLMGGG